jgi:hypothetical protein
VDAELPPPSHSVLTLRIAAPVAPGLDVPFIGALQPELQIEEIEGRPMVVGWGMVRREKLLALLRTAPEPVRVRDLPALLGGLLHMPPEVLYLGHGLIGLPKHFPDMERWRRKLVPLCDEMMDARLNDASLLRVKRLDAVGDQAVLGWLRADANGIASCVLARRSRESATRFLDARALALALIGGRERLVRGGHSAATDRACVRSGTARTGGRIARASCERRRQRRGAVRARERVRCRHDRRTPSDREPRHGMGRGGVIHPAVA